MEASQAGDAVAEDGNLKEESEHQSNFDD